MRDEAGTLTPQRVPSRALHAESPTRPRMRECGSLPDNEPCRGATEMTECGGSWSECSRRT
eukprot:729618-Alexandrium_andersonii.AAC.1